MIKELADVIVRPLLIPFEQSCQLGEVPKSRGRQTSLFRKSRKEDPGKYMTVSLTLIPGKVMMQLIPETIPRHVTDKKANRSSQHGFTKVKSCLTNSITFYNEIYSSVDDRRPTDIVHLDLSKALTVSSVISPYTEEAEEVWVGWLNSG